MAIVLKQILGPDQIAAGGGDDQSTAVGADKIQTVKGIRLVNKHASAAVVLNVTIGDTAYQVSPKDFSLGPGQMYEDDGEFILAEGDYVKIASGAAGGPVDYLVSGFERDQS